MTTTTTTTKLPVGYKFLELVPLVCLGSQKSSSNQQSWSATLHTRGANWKINTENMVGAREDAKLLIDVSLVYWYDRPATLIKVNKAELCSPSPVACLLLSVDGPNCRASQYSPERKRESQLSPNVKLKSCIRLANNQVNKWLDRDISGPVVFSRARKLRLAPEDKQYSSATTPVWSFIRLNLKRANETDKYFSLCPFIWIKIIY